MSDLAPLNQQISIGTTASGENVSISAQFLKWLMGQLFVRVGGATAPTMTDLDQLMQYDIREADGAELAKRVDALTLSLLMAPDHAASIARLNGLIAEIQVAVHSFTAATDAEAAKRISAIETLQAFK